MWIHSYSLIRRYSFNTELYTMAQEIEAFDEQITALTDSIGQLSDTIAAISAPEEKLLLPAQVNNAVHGDTAQEGNAYGKEKVVNNIVKDTSKNTEQKEILSDVKIALNVSKTGTEVATTALETAKHISPKLLEGIEKTGKVFEAGMGAVDLAKSAYDGADAKKGDAMEAAMKVALAAASFGPAGLVVAGAAAITGGVIEFVNYEKRKDAKEKAQEQHALKSFEMTSAEAEAYIKAPIIAARDAAPQHAWHLKTKPYDNGVVKAIEKIHPGSSVSVVQGITNLKEQKTIELVRSFLNDKDVFKDKQQMEIAMSSLMKGAGKYGKMMGIDGQAVIQVASSAAKYDWVTKANEGKTEEEIKAARTTPAQGTKNTQQQSGNTIVLNMNKSMIEKFTVNTTNVKESTAEIKHIVETTLLETLQHLHTNG